MPTKDELVDKVSDLEAEIEEYKDQLAGVVFSASDATIDTRIQAIMLELEPVKKSQESGEGYSYRGIDQIINALSPLLAKHGVSIRAVDVEVGQEWVTTREAQGNRPARVERLVDVIYTYEVRGLAGDSILMRVGASAMNPRDKATVSAGSYAYRTAVSTLFAIPTDAPDVEADDTPVLHPGRTMATQPTTSAAVPAPSYTQPAPLTPEQNSTLSELIGSVSSTQHLDDLIEKLQKEFGPASDLTQDKFEAAKAMIEGFIADLDKPPADEAEAEAKLDKAGLTEDGHRVKNGIEVLRKMMVTLTADTLAKAIEGLEAEKLSPITGITDVAGVERAIEILKAYGGTTEEAF